VKLIDLLRRAMRNSDSSTQSLAEFVAGTANQSDLLNRKLNEIAGIPREGASSARPGS
jgi:hypothetical protein